MLKKPVKIVHQYSYITRICLILCTWCKQKYDTGFVYETKNQRIKENFKYT